MITNHSGKFRQPLYSHAAADQDVTPETNEEDINFTPTDTGDDIPPCPEEDTMTKVRRLFGELWWLWIAAAVIYFVKLNK